MRFSGYPALTLKWFAGDDELDAIDNSGPGFEQRDVTRTVTIDDCQRPFRCVARFGDLEQVCEVFVEVPH